MKSLIAAAALAAATLAAPAYANTYALDPTHTFVTYEISHFGTSTNRGRFDKKEGTVQFDRAAKTGKVDVSFELNSVDTGVAMLCVLLARLAAIRWHLALPRFHLLNRD